MPPKAKRGRGRPSNASRGVVNVAKPTSIQAKTRGRPPKGGHSAQRRQPAEEDDDMPEPSRRSKLGRPPNLAPEVAGSRKRKARDAEEEVEDEPASKKFQHLRTRSRYVPQAVIAAKWQAPTHQMQEQIKNIFKTALRPVVASRRDERRRLEAEQVVGAMIRKLEQRLPKMPFPPNTKDTDFDLEKVVERNRMLENQLTPAMHSIDLLKAAIEKEEAQLERDKEVLAEFEENAKAEKTALKNMSVKPHPMLRLPKNFEIGDDSAEDIGLVRQKTAKQALFDDPDPDFAPLLDTLRNHLESMQGNHEQVQGIDAVMQEAQAALDDVLFTHASPQQYDSMSRP